MLGLVLTFALWQSPGREVAPIGGSEPLVTTRHRITVGGASLGYRATAGRLPILDNETGEVRAWMFFVGYFREPGAASRPVTFAWNGGPGSNAGLIQLGGIGPRRFTDHGRLVDNRETWLDWTDLVFIDPVGTGYSRVTRPDLGSEFYQTKGDAESVAEFIRVFRTRFGRWGAPVYLAGESFGVTRAAGVAEAMVRRKLPLQGITLIGLEAPLVKVPRGIGEALRLPGYAAAASHHGRLTGTNLERAVAAATRFALDTLGPALRSGGLSAGDRDRLRRSASVHAGVALPVDSGPVVVEYHRFARLLLADRGLRLGHYDTRLTGPMDPPDRPYDPTIDPSLQGPPPPDGVVRYLRDELGYGRDLQYSGPFGGVYPPPQSFRGDWMSVRWRWTPAERGDSVPGVTPELPLRVAMERDEGFRVFVACGYFDLICVPAVNDWIRDQLPAPLRERVKVAGYRGGHAVYLDDAARAALATDVRRYFGPRDGR